MAFKPFRKICCNFFPSPADRIVQNALFSCTTHTHTEIIFSLLWFDWFNIRSNGKKNNSNFEPSKWNFHWLNGEYLISLTMRRLMKCGGKKYGQCKRQIERQRAMKRKRDREKLIVCPELIKNFSWLKPKIGHSLLLFSLYQSYEIVVAFISAWIFN